MDDARGPAIAEFDIEVPVGHGELAGRLAVPDPARGLVVFAHGSGSSRRSPRNRAVAASLERRGFATLLFDLLTPAEAADRANVFDIGALADRLDLALAWTSHQRAVGSLPVGLFGASTGAGAAVVSAARVGDAVSAVVSRGGRVDLAGPSLEALRSPTLMIVGGRDEVVLDLNRRASAVMRAPNRIEVVPGATHLFEEPGALERVTDLAGAWFERHLVARPA